MPVLSGKPRFLWQQIRYFFQEGVGFQKMNVGSRVARDDLKQCVGIRLKALGIDEEVL
jgi:hypothetical protein